MTVLECINKYGFENSNKFYKNVFGDSCNLMNLTELSGKTVKSFTYNLFDDSVEITIIHFGNK